ncbi:MAG: ribosomal protein, partial [Armatimonadota bacterium]
QTKGLTKMYAVIRTGGKQYRVSANDTIVVEKLEGEVGDAITIDDVLLIGGETTRVGLPVVAGASVSGTIVKQCKGKKINGITYIKVKQHQRHYGHRQLETHIRIDGING